MINSLKKAECNDFSFLTQDLKIFFLVCECIHVSFQIPAFSDFQKY